jgi:hypothetical protein
VLLKEKKDILTVERWDPVLWIPRWLIFVVEVPDIEIKYLWQFQSVYLFNSSIYFLDVLMKFELGDTL